MPDKKVINWYDLDKYKLQHMSVVECNAIKIIHMHLAHKKADMPVITISLNYKDGVVLMRRNNMQDIAIALTVLAERVTENCITFYKAMEFVKEVEE